MRPSPLSIFCPKLALSLTRESIHTLFTISAQAFVQPGRLPPKIRGVASEPALRSSLNPHLSDNDNAATPRRKRKTRRGKKKKSHQNIAAAGQFELSFDPEIVVNMVSRKVFLSIYPSSLDLAGAGCSSRITSVSTIIEYDC